MRRRGQDEQDFLRDIDRLLAGEEVHPGQEASQEYRATLEFASRLVDRRGGPSPEFRDRLWARLMARLAEHEERAYQAAAGRGRLRELLERLVPRTTAMRTAMVTITVVLVAVGVIWGTGVFGPAPAGEAPSLVTRKATTEEAVAPEMTAREAPAPAMASLVAEPPLVLDVPPGPLTASTGAEITLQFSLRNTSGQTATVEPFPPRLVIVPAGTSLPVRTIPAGTGSTEIGPFGTTVFAVTWDQRDDAGEPVPAGEYSVLPGPVTVSHGDETGEVSFDRPLQVIIR